MNMSSMALRRLAILSVGLLAGAGALVVSAQALGSGTALPSIVPSYQAVHSIERLVEHADRVVVGQLGDVVAREVDFGGDVAASADAGAGVPMAFYELHVHETVKGDARDTVVVGMIDEGGVNLPSALRLTSGATYLLFLRDRDSESAPGITVVEEFYVLLWGPAGVFDSGRGSEEFVARSTEVVAINEADVAHELTAGSASSGASEEAELERLTVTLDEVRAHVGG